MAKKLTAPRMGEGVEEVTVVRWIKAEGDPVAVDEAVVEVETEKVAMEIPSPYAGTLLKIAAQPNQKVPVGEVLAWIGETGESPEGAPAKPAAAPPKAEAKPTAPAAKPAAKGVIREYTGVASPLVRKLAAENNIDLNLVTGTGVDGMITKQDIQTYLEGKAAGPAPAAPAPVTSMPAASAPVMPLEGKVIPHSPFRLQIAERMVASMRTSPHVLTVMEADMSWVLAHHAVSKPQFAAKGVTLTLTAYFIAAIVAGLKENPEVNSSWTDEGLVLHPHLNIGMAVALGNNGLIVPVIRSAEGLGLLEIARQVTDLAERARAKKLLPDEVRDGTFSLTNHGTGGSLFASPIIVQPQVGVLGTGRMQKRAVVVTDTAGNDAIAVRPMIYLSFVFDHRVLDGEGADKFLKKVKDTLENWV